MRIRSAAVVVRDEGLLVIDRTRDGRRYCVLPGGGVEQGDSLREACRRELLEETGLAGDVGDLLDVPVDRDAPTVYFAVHVDSAIVALGGPEFARASEHNRYEPRWVDPDSVDRLPLVPATARHAVRLIVDTRR